MKKAISLLSLLCLLLSLGCAQDEKPNMEKPIEAPQGEFVTLALEGDVLATQNLLDGSVLRAMSLKKDFTPSATQWIRYISGKYKGLLYLQKQGGTAVTTVPIVYELKASADGKTASFSYSQKDIQLQGAGESFASGTWYISGLLSLIPETDSRALNANTDFLGSTQLTGWVEEATDEESLQIDVPLCFAWTKVTTDQTKGTASGLAVKPAGTLIKVRPQSNITEGIMVNGVTFKGKGLGFRGKFSPSALNPNSLSFPNFTATGLTAESEASYSKSLSTAQSLSSGDKDAKIYGYVWLMTTDKNNQQLLANWQVSASVDNQVASLMNMDENAKQVSGQSSIPQLISVPGGKPFPMATGYDLYVKVSSDLIISEHYQREFSAGSIAWIEIYNPTLQTVNLADYAVARAVYHSDTRRGPKYYTLHPKDVAQGDISKGLLQPLDIRYGQELRGLWGKSLTLGRQDMGTDGTYAGRADYNAYGIIGKSHGPGITSDYEPIAANQVPANLPLKPGQTAIFGANDYSEHNWERNLHITGGASLSRTKQKYNEQGNGPHGEKAYAKGYCAYLMAWTSRGDGASNLPHNQNSPVLDAGWEDAYVLVKRTANGSHRIIDVGAPILGTKEERSKDIFDRMLSNPYSNATAFNVPHTRWRIDAVKFPTTKFDPKQWAVRKVDARYTGGVFYWGEAGNAGVRSYLKPEKGLSWAAAGDADWSSIPAYSNPATP